MATQTPLQLGIDRPRPHGGEHRTTPAARRSSDRRAQPSAGAGRRARRERRNRRELGRGARLAARAAARSLAHAPGRRDHRERPLKSSRSGSIPATRSSTAETRTSPTTSVAGRSSQRAESRYLDCGTSGGIFGLERGYCLMIGGDEGRVRAPGADLRVACAGPRGRAALEVANRAAHAGGARIPPLRWERRGSLREDGPQRDRVRPHGRVRRGPQPAPPCRCRACGTRDQDAETAPLAHPEHYTYDLDVSAIAELWRRGSVVSSWLLDLTSEALHDSPGLDGFAGRVSDSGEGRWTSIAAIETGAPTPVLTTALYSRFTSRGEGRLRASASLGVACRVRRARREALVTVRTLKSRSPTTQRQPRVASRA